MVTEDLLDFLIPPLRTSFRLLWWRGGQYRPRGNAFSRVGNHAHYLP